MSMTVKCILFISSLVLLSDAVEIKIDYANNTFTKGLVLRWQGRGDAGWGDGHYGIVLPSGVRRVSRVENVLWQRENDRRIRLA